MAVNYEKNNRGDPFPDETFKPVTYQGFVYENYLVSQYGTVIGPKGIPLKWVQRSKSARYPCVCLHTQNYEDEKIARLQASRGRRVVSVHKLVAEAFLPISENLPYELQDIRRYLTKEHFALFERLFVVDHIDGDSGNPHVTNLQWVTQDQNHHVNKKYFLEGKK